MCYMIAKLKVNKNTCRQLSRNSSSSFWTDVIIRGVISPRAEDICWVDCRTTAERSWTVVRCFSILAEGARFGRISDWRSCVKNCGWETGMNWARVVIARLRTTGRECDNSGVRMVSGWRSEFGKKFGKRLIRMENIANVSTNDCGVVAGWNWNLKHAHY